MLKKGKKQMAQTMLSTLDNPYDPFTQFDPWFNYDESHGYHSCSILANVARTSDELSEPDQEKAISDAIDEIVSSDIPLFDENGNKVVFIKVKEKE